MNTETINKQLGALRDGDQAVSEALTELDAKLREWHAAMRAGQEALVAAPAQADTSDIKAKATAPETATEHVSADDQPELSQSARAELSGLSDDAAAPSSEAAVEYGKGMFQTTSPIGPARRRAELGLESEQPSDDAALSEEDEELMSQLDDQTAALIRVKRRLCANRRSVRELLEEIQMEQRPNGGRSKQQAQWWRRTNER